MASGQTQRELTLRAAATRCPGPAVPVLTRPHAGPGIPRRHPLPPDEISLLRELHAARGPGRGVPDERLHREYPLDHLGVAVHPRGGAPGPAPAGLPVTRAAARTAWSFPPGRVRFVLLSPFFPD